MKIQEVRFSEIPVPTYQIIRCRNADEYSINLHNLVQVQLTLKVCVCVCV